jgi:hypothetical protein
VKNYFRRGVVKPPTVHKESSKGPPTNGRVFRACLGRSGPAPSRGKLRTPTLPGRRRGQSWHRRPRGPVNGPAGDGVEPGHTLRPKGRSKGAHAVEFSKTVALFGRGIHPSGASVETEPVPPERTDEYSAPTTACGGGAALESSRPTAAARTAMGSPGRSPCGSVGGRRNRSARPAARCRARVARPPAGSTPTGRSALPGGEHGHWCRG